MYKPEYESTISFGIEKCWFPCQSEQFVDENGDFIHYFKNKEDATKVAKEWKEEFGEKVRIVKYNHTKKVWKEIKVKL